MSKLDWEKQNKAERPKQKRRESQRTKILKAYENGTKRERERITKLLNQLENEWRDRLAYNLIKDNSYETSRYRNYVLACADFRDAVIDPEILIKGEGQ